MRSSGAISVGVALVWALQHAVADEGKEEHIFFHISLYGVKLMETLTTLGSVLFKMIPSGRSTWTGRS